MRRRFMKNILVSSALCLLTVSGCTSFCKPPNIVLETVEQQGIVLEEIRVNLETISRERLNEALLTLIDSNKALQDYFKNFKEEKRNGESIQRDSKTSMSDPRIERLK